MNTVPQKPTTASDPHVVITRRFAAPRELVFQAWSDSERLMQWFAPEGCCLTIPEFEFRMGGTFRYGIHMPNGYTCWCSGAYMEIIVPERIVFTMVNTDAQGVRIDPVSLGMPPEWPAETMVTVTFAQTDNATTLTLHQTVSEALAKRTGAYPSWLSMLDRLEHNLG